MRVLCIAQTIDRAEYNAMRELSARGVEYAFMLEPRCKHFERMKEFSPRVTPLKMRWRIDPAAIRAIRSEIRAFDARIVYAHSKRALGNMLIASRGLPVKRVTYRGVIGHLSRWDPFSRLTYLNKRIDRIVCVSEAVRDYMLTLGIPPQRLVRIYKGHRIEWYAGSRRESLAALGVPSDAFVVVCAARMRPRKGVIDLVQAMRELAPDTNIHLLLVGEVCDPRLPRLVDQYHLSSSVHFTGFRDDAVSIIGACDVMVMPSWSEGLTRAVLEAMAQAVPPIVTRVGGLREMVEDGVSGLLVPPRDPPALARAIRALASDPAKRTLLGENARERMRALFNIEQTVDQTLAMYREMLG